MINENEIDDDVIELTENDFIRFHRASLQCFFYDVFYCWFRENPFYGYKVNFKAIEDFAHREAEKAVERWKEVFKLGNDIDFIYTDDMNEEEFIEHGKHKILYISNSIGLKQLHFDGLLELGFYKKVNRTKR